MRPSHSFPTDTDDLAVFLVREGARRFNAARTLADRIDAIDFGRDQIKEANERADRITQRVMPRAKAPLFAEGPEAFLSGTRHNYDRGQLRKDIYQRLLGKVIIRDGILDQPAFTDRVAWGMAA